MNIPGSCVMIRLESCHPRLPLGLHPGVKRESKYSHALSPRREGRGDHGVFEQVLTLCKDLIPEMIMI